MIFLEKMNLTNRKGIEPFENIVACNSENIMTIKSIL